MTKKITVKIKVIHEFGELIKNLGIFTEENIQKMVTIASMENMTCLSFIDLPRDTYFNTPQCKVIKNEVSILKKYEEIDKNLLDLIDKAADLAIEDEAFVKFEVAEL